MRIHGSTRDHANRRRLSVRWVGLLAAAVLALGITGAPAAAATTEPAPGSVTPDQDPFYRPPSPLSPGGPGTLIRSREFSPKLLGDLPMPAKGWQVLYKSTDARGKSTAVSGVLLVPHTPWLLGDRPLIGYGIGTHGLADQCAPSYWTAKGTEYEFFAIEQALLRGYAVVFSDYQGLGTPGLHTYLVKQAEGRAVLDAVRVASKVPHAGLSGSAPTAIWGYSQGGGAAAFAGELQPSYAPDLNGRLKGVASGGVPGDLQAAAAYLEQIGKVYLQAWAYAGYDAAYPELNLDRLLTPLGKQRMVLATTVKCEANTAIPPDDTADPWEGMTLEQVFTTTPRLLPAWADRFEQNRAGQAKPAVPLYLYHSPGDDFVAYEAGRDAFHRYCTLGATVQWQDGLPGSHIGGAVSNAPIALSWIDGRFAGLPPTDSC